MFKTITSILTKQRTLNAELKLDHIELSGDQLIVGLQVTWYNDTLEAIEISNVLINLFHMGKKETPIPLIYHGRFVRIPYQKSITKIAGATSFRIKSGATQVESLRFLTREIHDLKTGLYAAELHSTVEEGTYFHNFDLLVAAHHKCYAPGQEKENDQPATTSSSAYTRALRLGSDRNASRSAA